jgi:hypothetical protein
VAKAVDDHNSWNASKQVMLNMVYLSMALLLRSCIYNKPDAEVENNFGFQMVITQKGWFATRNQPLGKHSK